MKPINDILRSLGWWLETALRHGHSRDLLHHRMVDLIAWVVHRENVTPDEAVELLRGGYLFRVIEDAVNGELQQRG